MDKKIVRFEELLAGALLKFESVDEADIALFKKELTEDDSIKYIDTELPFIREYLDMNKGIWSLKKDLTLKSNVTHHSKYETFTLKQKLEHEQGEIIPLFLNSLDLTEFVLRKILYLPEIDIKEINKLFNKVELEILNQLFEKKYIKTEWNDDIPHLDFEQIIITDLGKLYLFKKENNERVNSFATKLKESGYDVNLLDSFLKMQDLNDKPSEIINIYNFLGFCDEYDISPYPDLSKLNFIKLNYQKETIFDKEGIKLLMNMLSIWDDEHKLYICHPNDICSSKPISSKNKEIDAIDWDDIDSKRMLEIGDYLFISNEWVDSFKYIHNRLKNEIMTLIKYGRKEEAVRYLAIVEEYPFNYEDNFLVRGFIRGDQDGYSIAFNPEYEESIPTNIWEKSLRFSGNEAPLVYNLRRNGRNS